MECITIDPDISVFKCVCVCVKLDWALAQWVCGEVTLAVSEALGSCGENYGECMSVMHNSDVITASCFATQEQLGRPTLTVSCLGCFRGTKSGTTAWKGESIF